MSTVTFGYQNSFNNPTINPLWLVVLVGVFTAQNVLVSTPIFANESSIVQSDYLASIIKRDVPVEKTAEVNKALEEEKWRIDTQTRYKNYKISPVNKGIIHIQLVKYINSTPVKINVVEINRKVNPDLVLTPKLASADSNLKQKATIKTIANNNNSIVAINGTYFKPENGVPLGTLMIDRKLYTGPIYDRVAMGISANDYKMARLTLNANVKTEHSVIKIDNINQPRMLSTYTLLYTKDWGKISPPAPKYGASVLVQNDRVIKITTASIEIPQGGYVISAPKDKIAALQVGEKLELDIKTNPNWGEVEHIISGGPYLVKEGNTYVDVKEQKLGSVNGKNPRTAIGYTVDGNLILVTVDGREKNSVGMTLFELARFMKELGCVNAMNLDGGGSSVMYINGKVVNSPAQTGGIAISNALTISSVQKNSDG